MSRVSLSLCLRVHRSRVCSGLVALCSHDLFRFRNLFRPLFRSLLRSRVVGDCRSHSSPRSLHPTPRLQPNTGQSQPAFQMMAAPSVQQSDRPIGGTVQKLVDRLSKDLTAKTPAQQEGVNFRRAPAQSSSLSTTSTHSSSIALVRFSYAAAHDDELSLAVDDRIEVIDEAEEGWMRGRLHGRVGVFPTNFVAFVNESSLERGATRPNDEENSKKNGVDHVEPPTPEASQRDHRHSGPPSSVVRSSGSRFRPLPAGASVTLPATDSVVKKQLHVHVPAGEANAEPAAKGKELARVLHPYTAAHEDELSLPVGALVTVLKKECDDAGWFYGELDGKRGVFPDNFVQLVASGGGESMAATAPPASPPQQPATPAPMPPVVAPAAVVAQTAPVPKPPVKPPAATKPPAAAASGFAAARSAISAGLQIGPPGSAVAANAGRLSKLAPSAGPESTAVSGALASRALSEPLGGGGDDANCAAGDAPGDQRLQHLNLNRPKQNKRPPSQLFFKEQRQQSIEEIDSPTRKSGDDHSDSSSGWSSSAPRPFAALVPPAAALAAASSVHASSTSTSAAPSGDWVSRADFDRLAEQFAHFKSHVIARLEKLEKTHRNA